MQREREFVFNRTDFGMILEALLTELVEARRQGRSEYRAFERLQNFEQLRVQP